MLLDWLGFPLIVLAVSLGCGLLVERIGGWSLPGTVLPGVGLALVVVVASLVTQSATLAPDTTWLAVALALIGYIAGWKRLAGLRPDPYAVGVCVVLFLILAAPTLAFGHVTYYGYGVDGDASFHFLMTRLLLAHGYQPVASLPFQGSTTEMLTAPYLQSAYPFGADLALGALRPLAGQGVPWLYDPFLSTAMTFGALGLLELLRDLVRSRPLRALCAFTAAQSGLAYSFLLISSIKELFTITLITVLVVLVVRTLERRPSARALSPLIVATAAELYVLEIPAVPWLGIPLAAFAVASLLRVRSHLRRPSPRALGGLAVTLAGAIAIVVPIIATAATSFKVTTTVLSVSSGGVSIGNLLAPLNLWEILGIWPSGDYRAPVTVHVTLAHALLWVALLSAVLGALWTLRRHAWGPLLLLLGNGIAALVLLERATPYAASKVMAILSVTAVLAAMLGAAALHDLTRRWLGWTLALVLALGVLWTNGKAFEHAPLAPAARFAELTRIDHRFRGQGPTYYDMWDFEWPAFFLSDMGPYVPNIYGQPTPRPGTGPRTVPQLQYPWDLADVTYAFQTHYRLMVLGRSPFMTRPPADYRLVYEGRYYDVFRRDAGPRVLSHVVASDEPDAPLYRPAPLTCRRIARLGARALAEHARLAFAAWTSVASTQASRGIHPATWQKLPIDTAALPYGLTLPSTAGTLRTTLRVPRAGTYTVWVQGRLTQRMTVTIGAHRVGSIVQQIGPGSMFTDVGRVRLPAGASPVLLTRAARSRLVPTAVLDTLGEIALSRSGAPPGVHTVPAREARTLCGRPGLQWIETVR
jgi:hypothetical protein